MAPQQKRRKPAAKKRKNRPPVLPVLGALLVAVALLVVLFLVLGRGGEDAVSSSSQDVAPSSSQPVPSSQVVASSVPPQAWPLFPFAPEDAAAMDEMLAAWAAAPTIIRVTQDAEGNSLPQPVEDASGGHRVGVWFYDIESGAQYGYNAEEEFYYASCMKGPYAAWLYQLANEGACNLDEEIAVTYADVAGYEQNTGKIKEMELPAVLTVEELIGYMLRNSDTVALKVLLKHYSAEGFVAWAESLGLANAARLNSVVYGRTTPADAGLLMQAVYDYIQAGQYGARLKTHMESATHSMIESAWPVAHKYGWDKDAYHDMAVVYAPRPYILVIFTDKWGGSWEEKTAFARIAAAFEERMEAQWAAQVGP